MNIIKMPYATKPTNIVTASLANGYIFSCLVAPRIFAEIIPNKEKIQKEPNNIIEAKSPFATKCALDQSATPKSIG